MLDVQGSLSSFSHRVLCNLDSMESRSGKRVQQKFRKACVVCPLSGFTLWSMRLPALTDCGYDSSSPHTARDLDVTVIPCASPPTCQTGYTYLCKTTLTPSADCLAAVASRYTAAVAPFPAVAGGLPDLESIRDFLGCGAYDTWLQTSALYVSCGSPRDPSTVPTPDSDPLSTLSNAGGASHGELCAAFTQRRAEFTGFVGNSEFEVHPWSLGCTAFNRNPKEIS